MPQQRKNCLFRCRIKSSRVSRKILRPLTHLLSRSYFRRSNRMCFRPQKREWPPWNKGLGSLFSRRLGLHQIDVVVRPYVLSTSIDRLNHVYSEIPYCTSLACSRRHAPRCGYKPSETPESDRNYSNNGIGEG